MAVTIKSINPIQLGIADTTLYTCPIHTHARILKMTVCNDDSSVPDFSINKVPSGGAVGNDNLLISYQNVGGNETYDCWEVNGHALNEGDVLSGIASVAGQLTVAITVVEFV